MARQKKDKWYFLARRLISETMLNVPDCKDDEPSMWWFEHEASSSEVEFARNKLAEAMRRTAKGRAKRRRRHTDRPQARVSGGG